MDEKTMGGFLSALRKANGYTQQQVADALCVSNKTVSKWERGDGYPEITMLPAIAELYGVTVDEILKGQRITESTSEKEVERKTKEQAKLIMEKTNLRFKNCGVIAVALGLAGMLLTPFVSSNLYKDVYIIALIIVLVMTVSALIIAIVTRNNYLSSLKSDDIEETDKIRARIKTNRIIIFNAAMVLTSIITGLSGFVYGLNVLYVWLLTFAVVSVAAFVSCYMLNSKTEGAVNPKIKRLSKKILWKTVIAFATVILLNFCIPFAVCFAEAVTSPSFYNFTLAPGYEVEGIENYNKLKAYFAGTNELYTVKECSSEQDDYHVECEKYNHSFTPTEKGYLMDRYEVTYSTHYFDSSQELEQFLKNNAIFVDLEHIIATGCQITFDDEKYEIRSVPATADAIFKDIWGNVPVFVLTAAISCLGVAALSGIVYNKKKKSLH